jgi:hypothetical protein
MKARVNTLHILNNAERVYTGELASNKMFRVKAAPPDYKLEIGVAQGHLCDMTLRPATPGERHAVTRAILAYELSRIEPTCSSCGDFLRRNTDGTYNACPCGR